MVGLHTVFDRHLLQTQLAPYGSDIFGTTEARGEDQSQAVFLLRHIHGSIARFVNILELDEIALPLTYWSRGSQFDIALRHNTSIRL